MEFVEKIKQKAKSDIKTIVLPEAFEERNVKAADKIIEEGFANLISALTGGKHYVMCSVLCTLHTIILPTLIYNQSLNTF